MVSPGTAARVSCDSSTVTHVISDGGEPLALGPKTRLWSTAQRRAAMVPDGGTSRHHLLHAGYQAARNPNVRLTFHRPDGTPIGSTTPATACPGGRTITASCLLDAGQTRA